MVRKNTTTENTEKTAPASYAGTHPPETLENNPGSQGPNVIAQLGANFFISNEKILSCTSIIEAVKAAQSQYDYTRAPENRKLSQPPLVQGAAESFEY